MGILASFPFPEHFVFVMGISFLFLVFLIGYLDYHERLFFGRFAAGMVRDLRRDAAAFVAGLAPEDRVLSSGNLSARLIGDAVRVKAGLHSFLVQVTTGGLVFLGVTGILMWMHVVLGLIFAIAGVGTAIVTVWGGIRIFKKSLMKSKKEGKISDRIYALREEKANSGGIVLDDDEDEDEDDEDVLTNDVAKERPTRSHPKAAVTRIQGTVTWIAHGLFGIAVLAALWVGSELVRTGQIQSGDMVVFMMYTLMIHGPIVRLARQGCRSGKILGSAYRLEQIFRKIKESDASDSEPLSVDFGVIDTPEPIGESSAKF
jgi:ABC-type multidrug transport system fused ATPase/permease subunit